MSWDSFFNFVIAISNVVLAFVAVSNYKDRK